MKRLFKFIDRYPVVFVLITVLLVFAGINYAAHLFLGKTFTFSGNQDSVMAKIYGDNAVEDYKTVFREQEVGQKYSPFVEYIEKARNGKFVNVSSQGTRCHFPDQTFCIAKGGGKEIWIFGGSTTFGYGVKDNETIAAYLNEKFPNYRVINFGAASYYSTIERIRFENLLTELPPPKVAVFIDGLNDFYYFNVPDESAVTRAYAVILNKEENPSSFSNNIRKRLEELAIYRFLVVLKERFGLKVKPANAATASDEQILKAVVRLNINHSITEAIGEKLGITILNVIQPIPLYGAGHKTSQVSHEVLNFGDHANSGAAYKEMLDPKGELHHQTSHTLNLASLEINEGMYVDTVHYSPLFNKRIALEIHGKLATLIKN